MVKFDVPILFLIFNRPDTTQKVFNQIRKIKPTKLFIAADGPRSNINGEVDKCRQSKNIINQIDWDCELKTLFRDSNLGCGKAVSSAIDWFFENVEEGIILEDDCLPDLSFFDYCKLLLDKYRYEPKVMVISGTNFLLNKIELKESYYFSNFYSIWGWATWKRAWKLYDFSLQNWKRDRDGQINLFRKLLKNSQVVNFWIKNFDLFVDGTVDTWDFQWCYACIINQGLSAVSSNNLVSNIGLFGAHGTGNDSPLLFRTFESFKLSSVIYPNEIKANLKIDKIVYKTLKITLSYPNRCERLAMDFLRKCYRRIRNKVEYTKQV